MISSKELKLVSVMKDVGILPEKNLTTSIEGKKKIIIRNDLMTQNSSKLLKTINLNNFLPVLSTPKMNLNANIGKGVGNSLSPKDKELLHSKGMKNLNVPPPIQKIVIGDSMKIKKYNITPKHKVDFKVLLNTFTSPKN